MQNVDEFAEAVKPLLAQPKKIVVTNHTNPDGDAMGSALALAALLQAQGHQAQVIVPNEYAPNLKWIGGNDQVLIYAENEVQSQQALQMAELIFHLDYNALKRSGPMEKALAQATATKIMIDHHQEPEDFAQHVYSDTGMSSTCEMVYHFLVAMGWQSKVSLAVAEAIYTGIATDTGNFRFDSTTAATHQAAAFLVEKGVNPGVLASRVYDTNSPARLKLLSRLLNKLEILKDCRTALLTLSQQDFDEIGYHKGITEGFVNYGLSLEGIEVSVFAYPGKEGIKMSFRSKATFNVNSFARAYFNGGGHNRAAGALSPYSSLEETVAQLKQKLKEHQHELQA
jgi:phosphoesterase RecJ-like protein